MLRRLLVGSILTSSVALVVFASAGSAGSGSGPCTLGGQRMVGNASFDPGTGHFVGGGATIEPAWDDSTGTTCVYLRTPNNAKSAKNLPSKMVDFFPALTVQTADLSQQPPALSPPGTFSLPVNVAPIFLPVYPTGWFGTTPPTLNCTDNCPDHGPGVAGLAALFQPSVYGSGVLGHDHLVGVAKTGGDFNVLWEPVLVLFNAKTPSSVYGTRITTLKQITDLGDQVTLVALPQLTFPCSVEGPAAYLKAMPA